MRAATLSIGLTLVLSVSVSAASGLRAQTTRNVPAQYPTIQLAIAVAQTGDTVAVAAGTYNEAINFTGKAITIVATQGALLTTIQGVAGQAVVTASTGEGPGSILNGFTIRGGAPGILITRASPTIMNCIVTQNAVVNLGGGGVRIVSDVSGTTAAPLIVGCRITQNQVITTSPTNQFPFVNGVTATGGGVGAVASNGGALSLSFTDNVIAGNSALLGHAGGGLSVIVQSFSTANVTMTRCVIEDNIADNFVGGVYAWDVASLSFNRCIIRNNIIGSSAGGLYPNTAHGGVFANSSGTVSFVGCEISGHSIVGPGAAIGTWSLTSQGSLQIQNCTIAGNSGTGGVVFSSMPTVTVTSSILWGNSPNDFSVPGSTTQPSVAFCNIGPPYGSLPTNIPADPRFVDPSNGDYHLSSTSPSVNAGIAGAIALPPTDLDGTPRLVGQVDIGADERPNAAFPGSGVDLDLYAIIGNAGDPLTSTVNAPIGSLLTVRLMSHGSTYVGMPFMIAGQLYATGTPPALNPAFPMIQINAFGTVLLYSSVGGAPFSQPGLAPTGLALYYAIPPGLVGNTLRLQAFVVSPLVGPLGFVTTAARDVAF